MHENRYIVDIIQNNKDAKKSAFRNEFQEIYQEIHGSHNT